jgi:hypothetical protein
LPDLKYAVIFSAVDQLSEKLTSFGGGFLNLGNQVQEVGGKIGDAGESLTRFGERLSLDTMLMKDSADRLRELSDNISEPAFAMQKSLAGAQAMLGLTSDKLADLKKNAIDFSNTHPGVTAEQYVGSFTRMKEVFQDTDKAIGATGAAAMLTRFGIEGEAATNLFTAAYANLHTEATKTGDELIRTVQVFGLAPERAQQLAMMVGRLGGTAAQTNTPLAELLALGGAASQQLGGGGRGAMMFASMIREMVQASAEGKSSIDWSHGMADGLSKLRAQMAVLPTNEKIESLKKMGVADPGAMITFLDHLDQVVAKSNAIANSGGALGTAFKTATADASDQLALMHQNVTALYDAMATPALPWFNRQFQSLTSFVQGATSATEQHSSAAGKGVIALSVLGNAGYYGASALSTFGMATIGFGNGMKALGLAMKFGMDFEGNMLRLMYLGDAISNMGIITKTWAAAQWLVNAAMDANPIGLAIVGAVALGAAAYEIYEHWGAVRGMLSSFGTWVEGWAKSIGKAVLIGIAGPFGLIAYEIASHWDSIKAACEKLGSGILSYFEGHSPPKVGPLSHLGEHITVAETIADHIRPAPVLAAIRRTAAAAAIASTTIVGAGMAGPAIAGGGGSAGGGGGVVIHAPITIVAPAGADVAAFERSVLKALERHRYELARILKGQHESAERTVLS